MTSNKRSDGRFHSKWLSMMYPRLRLARNLLQEDGVIFISIDEHEQHNLKLIMIEIFGEENYVGEFIWKNKHGGGGDSPHIVKEHEFILIFSKDLNQIPELFSEPHPDYDKMFREKDDKGPFYYDRLDKKGIDQNRPNLRYPIECPDGTVKDISPAIWRLSKEEFQRRKENNQIGFKKDKNYEWQIYTKTYLYDDSGQKRRVKARSILKQEMVGFTQNGNKEIVELFGKKYFENPKPTELLTFLIDFLTNEHKESIILDFFAGSNSTAHSVLLDNIKNGANKKYIAVQIPDMTESGSVSAKEGFQNIAKISAHRMRLVARKYEESEIQDKGFRYLSLVKSNYKSWKNYQGTSTSDLESQLDLFNQNPLREGYSKDGLLTEIILLEGFTLCSDIEVLRDVTSNEIKKVTSEYCEHALLICLDEKIENETIANLQLGDADIFICLDSAVSTEDKLRLSDKGLIKTI
jgi:adenine-specific DNA-methyltransferase